jgi:OsmC-like protein
VSGGEEAAMQGYTWALRVSAGEGGQATVFTRQHQFRVGAPVHFDRAYGGVSALEYVLGAIGADLVNGLQMLGRRRRVAIHQVEALVEGELNNPLTYLGVVGETGHPGLEKVRVRVYLASSEEEAAVHRLWHEMLATSPLVHTFQAAIQFDLTLRVVL